MSHYKGERQPVTLRIPTPLLAKLKKRAKREGVYLNDLVVELLTACSKKV